MIYSTEFLGITPSLTGAAWRCRGENYLAREDEETESGNVHTRLHLLLNGKTYIAVDRVADPHGEETTLRFALPAGKYEKKQGKVVGDRLRILVPTADFAVTEEGGLHLDCTDRRMNYRTAFAYVTIFTEDENCLAGNALCASDFVSIRIAFRGFTECFDWKAGGVLKYHRENDPLDAVLGGKTDEEFLKEQRERFGAVFAKETETLQKRRDDPERKRKVLEKADKRMRGLYSGVPGAPDDFFVGNPPAWKEQRVHDSEYLWVIARFLELAPLTEAYLMTGDESYARKAVENVEDFIDSVPPYTLENLDDAVLLDNAYSDGTVNSWRQLEVGIRLFDGWRTFYRRILCSPWMTPAFHTKFALSVHRHLQQIYAASPLLWPTRAHNHYLHEMVGLLSGATMFPTFEESPAWTQFAMEELDFCSSAQFMADGAQLEGSPKYHNIGIALLLNAFEIASENGLTFSEEMNARLDRAMEHSAWFFSPACVCSAIGDSLAIDVLMSEITEKYLRATGSFGPYGKVVNMARRPSRETVSDDMLVRAAEERARTPGGVKAFSSVGQVYARTGWEKDDSWFSFVCKTPVYNGHAHADPCSVELVLEGDEVIVDPGAPTYDFTEMRKRYVSAPYHSCLTVGDREPFVLIRQWVYNEQKLGFLGKTYTENGYYAADAEQYNLEPAVQKRLVMMIGKQTFVVADEVLNPKKERVKLFFHMADSSFEVTDFGAKGKDVRILSTAPGRELIPSDRDSGRRGVVPSVRFFGRDDNPSEKGLYLHVVTKDESLHGLTINYADGGVRISFADRSGEQVFLWRCGKSLKRLKTI